MCEECVQAIAAIGVIVPMVPIVLSKAKGYVVNWSSLRLVGKPKKAPNNPSKGTF
jgi:hypothetical protein